MQLYFDFSGYSDMAIGLARIFGIRFPNNFNSPYKATCIIDFWQRWHMTLTRYLTAYLYNPAVRWVTQWRLAHGFAISRKATMSTGGFLTMIALPMLYTMVLAGIWHGAGWQFLIFGILHGSYLIVNHAWRIFGPRPSPTPRPRIAAWSAIASGVLLTYFAVLVAEIFFRAGSIQDALQVLAGMIGLHGFEAHEVVTSPPAVVVNTPIWILWISICFVMVWTLPNSMEVMARYEPVLGNVSLNSPLVLQWRPTLAWAVAMGCIFGIAIVGMMENPTAFLYFRF
jgi:alginate O-acetyltransferase complex protein AlgI